MILTEWLEFCNFRAQFKSYCIQSLEQFGEKYKEPTEPIGCVSTSYLTSAIKSVVTGSSPLYDVQTAIVYNHNIEKIKKDDNIKLVLVGDNPGKKEQEHNRQAYLVGQSGCIAENFFKNNSELGIDFRENVIILNKSILHTPKTMLLKELIKKDKSIEDFFIADQICQARYAILLQKLFDCPLWIVGYSQLGKKGLFENYSETIKTEYIDILNPDVYLYQHFSMNCFINQLKKSYNSSLSLSENLKVLGEMNRKNVLGF